MFFSRNSPGGAKAPGISELPISLTAGGFSIPPRCPRCKDVLQSSPWERQPPICYSCGYNGHFRIPGGDHAGEIGERDNRVVAALRRAA